MDYQRIHNLEAKTNERRTPLLVGSTERFALNTWIVAAVALAIFVMRRLDARFQHETFAFGIGFAVLVAAGLFGDSFLG